MSKKNIKITSAAILTVVIIVIVAYNKLSLYKADVNMPILMYHHIDSNIENSGYTIVTPDKFKSDMQWLKEKGYNTIFFGDIVNYVNGKGKLPKNPILISFDDGYLSNYEYAYPILKELDMKATIFIIGWSVGRDKHKDNITDIYAHFTYEQAKEMYESGNIDIQSHTYDMHNDDEFRSGMTQNTNESLSDYKLYLANDLNKLEDLVLENINKNISFISYPYGKYSENTTIVLKELGYMAAVTTEHGSNIIKRGDTELFYLKRINISQSTTMESIEDLITPSNKK